MKTVPAAESVSWVAVGGAPPLTSSQCEPACRCFAGWPHDRTKREKRCAYYAELGRAHLGADGLGVVEDLQIVELHPTAVGEIAARSKL